MAIDTKAKRASALNVFMLGTVLPPPDNATSAGDRQHAAGFYSGIAAFVQGLGYFVPATARAHRQLVPSARNHRDVPGSARDHRKLVTGAR